MIKADKSLKIAIDSGAHSLYNKYTRGKERSFDFYESDEFWKFVDEYASFIKEHKDEISLYVSVDVIFNAPLSWKVQKYLEDTHKLNPLPVFHVGEDFKWLKKYIDNYDYIGLGGLGQTTSKTMWIKGMGDPAFSMICDDKGYPRVKTHGFAMTSPELIIDYPFHSADSSSWVQFGKFGLIIIPKKRNGKFIYDESPHIISVSTRKKRKMESENFDHLPPIEKTHVLEYLEMKGFKMGSSDLEIIDFDKTKPLFPISDKEVSDKEVIVERGVCNDVYIRDALNLEYYLDLADNIPPYPRKWRRKIKTTQFPI